VSGPINPALELIGDRRAEGLEHLAHLLLGRRLRLRGDQLRRNARRQPPFHGAVLYQQQLLTVAKGAQQVRNLRRQVVKIEVGMSPS
jgi:hypothetical protein